MQTEFIQVTSKLTPQDWHAANYAHNYSSKKELEQSKMLRSATMDLLGKSAERARSNQTDVTKKIDKRLQKVTNWKSEVDRESQAVSAEMKALSYHINLLENALNSTENPLTVPKKSLSVRRKRTGNDLVRDNVEIQLYTEIEIIHSVQEALRRTIEHAMDQYRDLESCLKRLHKDSTDKSHAVRQDDSAYLTNNSSSFLGYFRHAVEYDPNASSSPEWEAYSTNNIARARNSRSLSENLRKKIQELLAKSMQQLNVQFNSVQESLGKRINETTTAKRDLENQIRKVMGEIEAVKDNIEMLEKNLAELQTHLKVNNTRLEHRTYRPNIEMCRDKPKHGLVSEYHALAGDINALKRRIQDSRNALERLNNRKWELEQEHNVKTFSLYIDKDQVGRLRKQMDWRPFLQRSGSASMASNLPGIRDTFCPVNHPSSMRSVGTPSRLRLSTPSKSASLFSGDIMNESLKHSLSNKMLSLEL
eukprot:Seg6559.1 transcript_id=Seg6559.1/GoldUCD/mRNA.D3Y31 product=Tektin-4 protein_id=Seg6559.1/GoldUCD/D3Y31